jgi:hypothetical protein
MVRHRDYTDTPTSKDVRAMLTPIAIGSGIALLVVVIYSLVG